MEKLRTGIENLEVILGGGLPLYSFNVIAGSPGTGKTILAQQLMFNNATKGSKALYLTTLSEPALKVVRYQQEFSFFDANKFGKVVVYMDIGQVIREEGLSRTGQVIIELTKKVKPTLLVIDSFKAIHDLAESSYEFRKFVYDLNVKLTGRKCTSVMVGEYTKDELDKNAEFAVADGVIYLERSFTNEHYTRTLEIMKMRGVNFVKGRHSFKISKEGITVFPRPKPYLGTLQEISDRTMKKVKTGIRGLDEMLGGGLIKGFSAIVAGSAGTGKTTLGLQFLYQGMREGDRGLLISFEERPAKIIKLAGSYNMDLRKMIKDKKLTILHYPPVELCLDELFMEIKETIEKIGVRRVVVDSLSDLDGNISHPAGMRDYIYSLVDLFGEREITCILTNEVPQVFGPFRISEFALSVIADTIIFLRYVEIESEVKKALSILKMRGENHRKEVREFQISSDGISILEPFRKYSGVLSGTPVISSLPPGLELSKREQEVTETLKSLGTADLSDLTVKTGIREEEVKRILDNLTETGYVIKFIKNNRTYYKVSMGSAISSI